MMATVRNVISRAGLNEISGRLIFGGQNVHLMCTVNIMFLYIENYRIW